MTFYYKKYIYGFALYLYYILAILTKFLRYIEINFDKNTLEDIKIRYCKLFQTNISYGNLSLKFDKIV